MGFLSSWAVSTIAHHAVKEFCAWKCGKKKYKYLILGDDCLDTDKEVYKTYLAVIGKLGVNVSLSKCTQSEIGYTEFAKRIFGPYGELTGIPVDLLLGILERPEQVIELVRILRERGYTDNVIIPGVQALIASWKTKKTIALVLSAPQELLGMPPINLEGVQSETEKFL